MPRVLATTAGQSLLDIGLDPTIAIPALRGAMATRRAGVAIGKAAAEVAPVVKSLDEIPQTAGEFYQALRREIQTTFTVTPEGVAVPSVGGRAMVPSGPSMLTKEFSNIGAARAFRLG